MPDSLSDPDVTGQRSLGERLKALETHAEASVKFHTRINTLVLVVGGVLSMTVGGLATGALATRDTVLANTARLAVVEQRVVAVDARDERRAVDDRTTREQLVEIRADVRAMREQLDVLSRERAREPSAHAR